MKILTTTNARKRFRDIVESVKAAGKPIAIGRRNNPEGVVIRFPRYNPELSDVTNLNALGGAFDFLWDEPDLYSAKDIKKRYAQKG